MSRLRIHLIALTVTLATVASASANTYLVTQDDDPSPISCKPAGSGGCSLREAINAANGAGTLADDAIDLGGRTVTLTLTGASEDANQTGDLDVGTPDPASYDTTGRLKIMNGTIVGATGERVIHLLPYEQLDLDSVTVRGGNAQDAGAFSDYGGGVRADTNAQLGVRDSTFSENSADRDGGAIGGADGSTIAVDESVFDHNAADEGGAIASSGDLTVSFSSFDANSAVDRGGAIDGGSGALSIADSAFTANTALDGGGVAVELTTTSSITDSSFSGNKATSYGGGLFLQHPTTATNITVTGNSATGNPYGYNRGGGIDVEANVTLVHATIAGNESPTGAELSVDNQKLTAANNLVAGSCFLGDTATVASQGGNVETGVSCGFTEPADRRSAAIRLGPLTTDAGHAVLPLLGGSAAIDAGVAAQCLPKDERGVPRPAGECDAGAYEALKADLGASLAVSAGTIPLGGDLTLMLTAVDNGPRATGGVIGTLPLPDGVAFVSGTGAACDPGPPVTCRLGSLDPGTSAAATIVVRPSAVGPLTLTGSVVADLADGVPGNDSASAQATVLPAGSASADTKKPKVSLALRKGTTLRSIRRTRRVPVRVRVSEPVALTLRAAAGKRKLGRAAKRLAKAGTATVTLRLTKPAARRLAAKRRLTLTAVAKDTAGNAGTVKRSVRIRRT
jgi:CSLREA domain-containing protein